jgi:dGTP triphosphohydrolase
MNTVGVRFPVGESRGRRYPEPPHPYRNEFRRDRDRIVHARAFRRLEDKTQVFTAGLSDHFRNRLTHTIEVAQIARTVASVLGLDEDLTETPARRSSTYRCAATGTASTTTCTRCASSRPLSSVTPAFPDST